MSRVSKPDNYLIWAVLATSLCCLPFGLLAARASARVDVLWLEGDVDGAVAASRAAGFWSCAAMVVGFSALIVLWVLADPG